jgi:hypothetical protein
VKPRNTAGQGVIPVKPADPVVSLSQAADQQGYVVSRSRRSTGAPGRKGGVAPTWHTDADINLALMALYRGGLIPRPVAP